MSQTHVLAVTNDRSVSGNGQEYGGSALPLPLNLIALIIAYVSSHF